MPRKYTPMAANWTKKQLENALQESEELGTSTRNLEAKYNIPRATIQRYIEKKAKNQSLQDHRGRKPVLSAEARTELKEVVLGLASLGFAPTLGDVGDLVKSYVLENNIEEAKKVFNYKGVKGHPGPDWIAKFLKDEHLSLKEATKLSRERHNATRNPYIIYKFYDLLEEMVQKLGVANRPDLIWNCDETGMPHEPKKCKVISKKGVKTLQVIPGADRENTTVMAACSAAGQVLPPLIIYPGQQVQLAWRPAVKDAAKYPWQDANPSGWMTTDVFYKWFKLWEQRTQTKDEDGNIEPRLMIYDCHLSHTGLETIRYAREFNVTIIKLPPHTTDLMQPLDVAVFCSLKSCWGNILFKRLQSVRNKLSKKEFSELLSSDDVWGVAFTTKNIEAGFRKCGIYPVNRDEYPVSRFSPPALEKYKKWIADGKPEICLEEVEKIVDEMEAAERAAEDDGDDEMIEHDGERGTVVSYFIPLERPNEMVRLETSPTVTSKNFKELCLQRLDATPKSQERTCVQRKGVNPYGEIVTSDAEFQNALEEVERKETEAKRKEEAKRMRAEAKLEKAKAKEEKKKEREGKKKEQEEKKKEQEEKKKENGKNKKEAAKKCGGKKPRIDDSSDDDDNGLSEDEEAMFDDESDDEDDCTDFKRMVLKACVSFPPITEKQAIIYLRSVWEGICPPVLESDVINSWFACIYYTEHSSKLQLFVGKVIRRFLESKDGIAQFLELDCLQGSISTTTMELAEVPPHLQRDVGLFALPNIIAGPLNGSYIGKGRWSFADYPDVVTTFILVSKIDRDSEYGEVYGQ